ncbi:MAPEG family protein [Sphingobium sp. H39-3-25]|uniref:MAPEG family protein n=1 Tax=Sphingobium arseniciresistens TaxID=3030834 RepID=UPI0023B90813|nr:MAPEG family protein [Sphingobium arseniciresistens]
MLLPITLTFAAAAALLNFWLALRVSRLRMTEKVLHGDGGCDPLMRRMRAHANFIEYTPFVLILCALVEMALGSGTWLWIIALVYIIARVAHAFGMDSEKPHWARAGGIMVTMIVMITLAVAALYASYSATRTIPAPPSLAARA